MDRMNRAGALVVYAEGVERLAARPSLKDDEGWLRGLVAALREAAPIVAGPQPTRFIVCPTCDNETWGSRFCHQCGNALPSQRGAA